MMSPTVIAALVGIFDIFTISIAAYLGIVINETRKSKEAGLPKKIFTIALNSFFILLLLLNLFLQWAYGNYIYFYDYLFNGFMWNCVIAFIAKLMRENLMLRKELSIYKADLKNLKPND